MTAHTLLTTIGAGKLYDEAIYTFDGNDSPKTRFFSHAVLTHLSASQPVTRVVVLLTKDAAKSSNWQGEGDNLGLQQVLEKFKQEVSPQLEIIPTLPESIPNGLSEEDIWTIFHRISDLVVDDSILTLDLTHGFRSLPLVMLLTIAYLKSAKNITINAVYYGAFAAQDRSKTNSTNSSQVQNSSEPTKAPVLDLSPFLTLFEWVTAVDAFERTGSLMQIAYLMRNRQDTLFKSRAVNDKSKLPTRFKAMASVMQQLSVALMLGRLGEINTLLQRLQDQLKQQEESARQWLAPLTAQINRIEERFLDLEPKSGEPKDVLLYQFKLVKWYMTNGHLIQAGLLLREWFISWYAYHDKVQIDWTKITTDKDEREKIEQRLSNLIQ